jgi:integration host factor subunit beta
MQTVDPARPGGLLGHIDEAGTSSHPHTMLRSDLIAALAEEIDHEHADASIRVFFSTITGALAAGRPVELRGFGRFSMTEMKARSIRNRYTGKEHRVGQPAPRVGFNPSEHWLTTLNPKFKR